jgi:hypothetical protein
MNKKDMVALIKKRAQDLGDPPGVDMKAYKPRPTAAPAASPAPPNLPPPPPPPLHEPNTPEAPEGGNPNPAPVQNYGPPASIVKMQSELSDLANTVTKQIGASALAAPPGAKPGLSPATPAQATDEQREAAGRVAFSNFITEHYMNQSDVKGVEFDPNHSKTQMDQKDPSKPTRMGVVMDTMSRIGGPGNEAKPDGKWGPRTNGALRNAYALAFALLKMAKDFKLDPPPTSYSESDLQELKELIPAQPNEISEADKAKRAVRISRHIQGIRNLFSEVKTRILSKPAYKSYIEGTQAYATYQKDTSPSPQMIQDLNKKFTNMKVVGNDADGKSKTVPITVSDLSTPQAFQLWLQTNLPSVKPEDALAQIKKHLDETDVSRGAT